jgi:hypothetical protein
LYQGKLDFDASQSSRAHQYKAKKMVKYYVVFETKIEKYICFLKWAKRKENNFFGLGTSQSLISIEINNMSDY